MIFFMKKHFYNKLFKKHYPIMSKRKLLSTKVSALGYDFISPIH
jgi:hypothetical protein